MKAKSILTGILIGIVAFPTITLGSSFVSSLIADKSVDEAVQILATQIDNLIGRVEIVEIKQTEQEAQIAKQEACRETDRLLVEIKEVCGIQPFPGLDECISRRLNYYSETDNISELNRADILKELKSLYLSAKNQCEL